MVRSLPHGHVAAVLGKARSIGLDSLIGSRPSKERSCVLAMVLGRILFPGSKLATARELNHQSAACTLGQELGLEELNENELYHAMDWLEKRQRRIENKLAKRHLRDGSLILYDVTSSYYTGTQATPYEGPIPRAIEGLFLEIRWQILSCLAPLQPSQPPFFAQPGHETDRRSVAEDPQLI